MQTIQQQFIEFALEADVLRFGEFKTKAGAFPRISSMLVSSIQARYSTSSALFTRKRFLPREMPARSNST